DRPILASDVALLLFGATAQVHTGPVAAGDPLGGVAGAHQGRSEAIGVAEADLGSLAVALVGDALGTREQARRTDETSSRAVVDHLPCRCSARLHALLEGG